MKKQDRKARRKAARKKRDQAAQQQHGAVRTPRNEALDAATPDKRPIDELPAQEMRLGETPRESPPVGTPEARSTERMDSRPNDSTARTQPVDASPDNRFPDTELAEEVVARYASVEENSTRKNSAENTANTTSDDEKTIKPNPAMASGEERENSPTGKPERLDAPSLALVARLSKLSSQSSDARRDRPSNSSSTTPSNSLGNERPPAPPVHAETQSQNTPRRHDFRNCELLSPEQTQSLESLHRKFAEKASATLSALARTGTTVSLAEVRQNTYFDFIRPLSNPTSLRLVYFGPQRLPLVAEMSPPLLFQVFDRLLGGRSEEGAAPVRPLTRVEQSLAGLILERLLEDLVQSWSTYEDARFELGEAEHNPLLMQVFQTQEPTLTLRFEASNGSRRGDLQLCLPTVAFHDVLSKIAAPSSSASSDTSSHDGLLDRLGDADVLLRAELPPVPIRLHDLVALQPGDIIDTELRQETEATISVDERCLGEGIPLTREGRRALRLARWGSEPHVPGETAEPESSATAPPLS